MNSALHTPQSALAAWPSPLPHEAAALDANGRLSAAQRERALSLAVAWSRRETLGETRAAFGHFGDGELVLLIHPQNKWAILARRAPGPRAHHKAADLARCRMSRREAPRNYRMHKP